MHGRDKAFLKIGNEYLINRQLRLLKKIFKEVIVVTNSPEKYKNIRAIKIITDVTPRLGPLGGTYSGLLASKSKYNFVIACDMPFINTSLIKYMLAKKNNYDIILPHINGKFHPLFGIYSRNCIPAIEENLKQNILKVIGILPKVRSRFISRKEIERFDKSLLSLVNVNTKEDLERIKEMKEK